MSFTNAGTSADSSALPKLVNDLEQQISALRGAKPGPSPYHQSTQQAAMQAVSPAQFEQQAEQICKGVFRMLVEKNRAYGNSVLEPVRIFSKASVDEQINVRLDDKLSRIQKGNVDFMDEDVLLDTIGYLIIKLIARQSHKT